MTKIVNLASLRAVQNPIPVHTVFRVNFKNQQNSDTQRMKITRTKQAKTTEQVKTPTHLTTYSFARPHDTLS